MNSGNEQMSLNMTIEVDQAQSIKNIQQAVDKIGKGTTIEVKGLDFDLNSVAKDFKKMVSQSFNIDQGNMLKGMTTVLKSEYGEILTIQHKVNENGTTTIENAKITSEALKVQKARYEEIRALYEKLGKLQVEQMTASKKKQDDIANEVKETQKLI